MIMTKKQALSSINIALMPIFLVMLFFVSPCLGASVTITAVDQGDGGVMVTANATFKTYTICDAQGKNCNTDNSGAVYILSGPGDQKLPMFYNSGTPIINPYEYYSGAGGNNSATVTIIIDRGYLHGTHSFRAEAGDHKESAASSATITINNTPSITLTGPSGDSPCTI